MEGKENWQGGDEMPRVFKRWPGCLEMGQRGFVFLKKILGVSALLKYIQYLVSLSKGLAPRITWAKTGAMDSACRITYKMMPEVGDVSYPQFIQ